jgi:hypothetical protein
MTSPNDELDELLRAAARDYNRPGTTPRDQMWESIRARRTRRIIVQRPSPWRRFILPAAAAAVLVVGVVIGRMYERLAGSPAALPNVATRMAPPDSGTSAHITATPPMVASVRDTSSEAAPSAPAPRSTHLAAGTSRAVGSAPGPTSPNLTFRLAVVEHLAGTEALLTSFRDEAARGDVDVQITSWARKLLTTTRLLQTAATQQDPTMKRLLDDLELVLVQIAQYSSTNPHRAEELELIEHSIQRRGVIGKLRTTIPARLAPSGT